MFCPNQRKLHQSLKPKDLDKINRIFFFLSLPGKNRPIVRLSSFFVTNIILQCLFQAFFDISWLQVRFVLITSAKSEAENS